MHEIEHRLLPRGGASDRARGGAGGSRQPPRWCAIDGGRLSRTAPGVTAAGRGARPARAADASPTSAAWWSSRAASPSSAWRSSRPAAPRGELRRGGHRDARRSRTTRASRRSSTAASRRSTRASTPACWRCASSAEHVDTLDEHEIEPIDLVCVNLYPFERVASRRGRRGRRGDREHRHRRAHADPRGGEEPRVRRGGRLARRATTPCSRSCARASGRLSRAHAREPRARGVRLHGALRRGDLALVRRARGGLPGAVHARLREGARPPLRREPAPARGLLRGGRARARDLLSMVSKLHGKELSFNNLLDLDSGRRLVEEFELPAAAIIKHNNPCGVRGRRATSTRRSTRRWPPTRRARSAA